MSWAGGCPKAVDAQRPSINAPAKEEAGAIVLVNMDYSFMSVTRVNESVRSHTNHACATMTARKCVELFSSGVCDQGHTAELLKGLASSASRWTPRFPLPLGEGWGEGLACVPTAGGTRMSRRWYRHNTNMVFLGWDRTLGQFLLVSINAIHNNAPGRNYRIRA